MMPEREHTSEKVSRALSKIGWSRRMHNKEWTVGADSKSGSPIKKLRLIAECGQQTGSDLA